MNEERHEEIMTAISNLSAQFSEMLREFKKRGELLHEADDATLSTNGRTRQTLWSRPCRC